MADFPKLVTAFIVITLFSFLIVGFAVQLANNYGKDTSEISEGIYMTKLNQTLSEQKSLAEKWKSSFEQQSVFLAIGGIVLTGIFQLANTIGTAIITPFAILGLVMANVLGVPVIIINTISVLIILSMIFGIWRLIKSGF